MLRDTGPRTLSVCINELVTIIKVLFSLHVTCVTSDDIHMNTKIVV